jgi:putative (di)nucleoside polyphosphate hydrolase
VNNSKLPLRPNVCMLVYNSEKRLFLGERSSEPGVWQFPQGGIDPGATPEETVIKELYEELGAPAPSFKITKKLKAVHDYDFSKVPKYAIGKWRGQTQTFWLVEFTGSDSQFDFAHHIQEFMSCKWCTVDEVRKLAEPKRLPGYEPALKEYEVFLLHQ